MNNIHPCTFPEAWSRNTRTTLWSRTTYDRRRTTTVLSTPLSPFPRLERSPSALLPKCTTQSISTSAVKSQSQCDKQGLPAQVKCQPVITLSEDFSDEKKTDGLSTWSVLLLLLLSKRDVCGGDFRRHHGNEKLVVMLYFSVSHYVMFKIHNWTSLLRGGVFLDDVWDSPTTLHRSWKYITCYQARKSTVGEPFSQLPYVYIYNMVFVFTSEVCWSYQSAWNWSFCSQAVFVYFCNKILFFVGVFISSFFFLSWKWTQLGQYANNYAKLTLFLYDGRPTPLLVKHMGIYFSFILHEFHCWSLILFGKNFPIYIQYLL